VVLFTCVLFFLVGLPFCTRRGNEVLDVTDHFGLPYFLLLGARIEHGLSPRRVAMESMRSKPCRERT
jgi:hypothetical protein